VTTAPDQAPAGPKSSFSERIARLERLEQSRLADKEHKEEQRRRRIAGDKPSGGRHELVDRIERATRFPMLVVGIAWMVLAVIVLTIDVNRSASIVLVGSLFALWAIAFVEYLVRLVVTPDRRGYLKRRWIEPATVLIPTFQGWHLIGIEKVGLVVQEVVLRIEVILKHHSLFRVLLAAAGTLFLGAWLVLLFEENAKTSNIHNYADAVWWAMVTVTTVGYGDRFPVTAGGRTVSVILMLVGIGLIGVLTATVASVFIQEKTEANHAEIKKGHADLGQQLSMLAGRLADIERRLGATPEEVAAIDFDASTQAEADGPIEGDPGASTS
jgi:voltage-gated potassium channel